MHRQQTATDSPEIVKVQRGRLCYQVLVKSRSDRHVIWLVNIPRNLSSKPTCGCKGYQVHGECAHCVAALEELLRTEPARIQRRAPAKAVCADPDPFTEMFGQGGL